MGANVIIGAVAFLAAAFLAWRGWKAWQAGAVFVPWVQIQTRRINKSSDRGTFTFAIGAYALLALVLLLIALRQLR